MSKQKVTPFIWFDSDAEEAARFYVSLFPDSEITQIIPGPDGPPLIVEFKLAGVTYVALNGGPTFPHTEAFSLSVACEDQAEIDHFWDTLSQGGSPGLCGWLKDRFGLSWQIVPSSLRTMMNDPDPQKGQRVMEALMHMTKPVLAELQAAHSAE